MARSSYAWCSFVAAVTGPAVAIFDVPSNLQSIQARFEAWKSKYDVVCCETQQEYIYRLGVFAANDAEIIAHNRGNRTWTMGQHARSHLTLAEIRAAHGKIPNLETVSTHCPLTHDASEGASLPASVDWREKGAVTPVKNQGSCGSCWSFSTTGALEGAYFLKYGKMPSAKGFSEQNLVDCVKGGGGCGGGRQDWAFEWIKQNGGLCTEEDYPYEGVNGNCRNATCTVVNGSKVADCTAVAATEAALMSAVAQQPVAVIVNGDPFGSYTSGVITGNCASQPDHAVLVVGYGRDDSIDCDVPPAKGCPFWLVKDSYGVNHADNGYVRVQRGGWPAQWGGMCGILTGSLYPTLSNVKAAMLV